MVIHIVVGVGLCPGESELPGVGADGVEECLEQGSVRSKRVFSVCHSDTKGRDRETQVAVDRGGEKGEAMPPVSFHGKEATAD